MYDVFGMNYFVFCFLVLILVLFFTKEMREEGFFGMSPGTLTQLKSSSVPSCPLPSMNTSMSNPPSTPLNRFIQNNLTKKALKYMTGESDIDPEFYALM
jgi:hypothetical protein